MSIINKYRFLEEAYPDMLNGIGMLIQKNKLSHLFEKITITKTDFSALNLAKELCEMKIVENWEEQHTESFKAFCATYFDIASLLPVDFDTEYFIYEQIKIISFGYIGEHWHFVRQYLKAQEALGNPANLDDETWNKRLLAKCYRAIVGLVNKTNWSDIDHSISLINQLREEQAEFEKTFLGQVGDDVRPYGASELVSLYHLAKSIEVLGQYLIEGRPVDPEVTIYYHLGRAKEFCQNTGNLSLDLLLRFFEALAIKMIRNTIWYTTRGINNWVTQFNNFISRQPKGVFELLYPQRESIIDGELLNPAHRAIIVNLPTSSGKTMIAEYRILQALNQFRQTGGWVAYVVPTKALVNQIYVQLNKDLGSLGLRVEKASGAIELDGFEQYLIQENGNGTNFDVLITTYEKLSLLVRQGLGTTAERPLILTVVDEAHNIEEEKRGLTLELMLTTIKNDCELANFLLMTPDISNSKEVAGWLAGDRGKEIRLELDWWQPNERVVGAIEAVGQGRNYDLVLRTLHTDKATYEIGDAIPLISCQDAQLTRSQVCGSKTKLASCLSGAILDINSPIIVLASDVGETYTIAEHLYESAATDVGADEDVDLLIKLVKSELGTTFPLAKYLTRRIAVHSAALPDEIKFLIEDLMAKEKLQALVSTTTIAQGINFPVAAVIMGAYNYPFIGDMPVRDFWNLAGRVGRAGQKSMGWVGIAVKNEADLRHVTEYVMKASEGLRSQLIKAIDNALRHADQDFSRWLFVDERWSAVLQYISHLRTQTEQQEVFLAQLEQRLQSTLGYRQLPPDKRTFLRDRIRTYASSLTVADAKRADETGFSTVSVRQMIAKLRTENFSSNDWRKDQLFSEQNQSMQKLIGVMLETYEIRKSIDELSSGGQSMDRSTIAKLVIDWVNGKDIIAIATKFYPNDDAQRAIQKATKALYKIIANAATWGLAALQKMPTSGVNWENLSDLERKKMANIPAYLHYGVNTDEGVLMRKNNVPRTIANQLGELFNASVGGEIFSQASSSVSEWLTNQSPEIWNQVIPANSTLSGEEYKKVWAKLNGAL